MFLCKKCCEPISQAQVYGNDGLCKKCYNKKTR